MRLAHFYPCEISHRKRQHASPIGVESDGFSTVLYSYGGLSERTEVTVFGDRSRTRYWNVNDKATVVALCLVERAILLFFTSFTCEWFGELGSYGTHVEW